MNTVKKSYRFLLLFSFIILSCPFTNAQPKRFVYYFDADMNSVSNNNSQITGYGVKTGSGIVLSLYQNNPKRLLSKTDYLDSTLAVMNGTDIIYYENGREKLFATYKNNELNGLTRKWDSTGLLTDSIIYSKEKMQNKTRFEYDFSGKITRRIFTDSIKNTYSDIFYGSNLKKISEVNFTGDKGIWKYYNTDGSVAKTENLISRERKDASYPGGEEKWKDYLAKELNSLIAFENKAPEGEYVVFVSFTVDKEGNVLNITPVTRHGFGMEQEAVRVIQKSGKWTPASLYGKIIKSHRMQPVQFLVN